MRDPEGPRPYTDKCRPTARLDLAADALAYCRRAAR
jgi:hypothetical protein